VQGREERGEAGKGERRGEGKEREWRGPPFVTFP